MWRTTSINLMFFITKWRFQSTSHVWRTTNCIGKTKLYIVDFNPRPPCGGRLVIVYFLVKSVLDFNPRPPCGGRRESEYRRRSEMQFQSTSPVWRTTTRNWTRCTANLNFNPRPPCGGRRVGQVQRDVVRSISIHVPRVEDDVVSLGGSCAANAFQSTSPVWRTTNIVI